MRRRNRYLLLTYVVATMVTAVIMYLLPDVSFLPVNVERIEIRYLVSTSLFLGLAVVGIFLAARYSVPKVAFELRLAALVGVFVLCAYVRLMILGTQPGAQRAILTVLAELISALGVAFAVAYLAHSIYSRFLPTAIMRVRDVTPLIDEGRQAAKDRARHARTALSLFDLEDRKYIDTTKLTLRTRGDIGQLWRDWSESTGWSIILVFSFAIYIDVYPRVAPAFQLLLTSIMAGHLLALVPLLMLPAYPIDKLGAGIPVGKGRFELAVGFRHTTFRWTKLSFVPIIVIAVLVRLIYRTGVPNLADVMLIAAPTVAMVNLVYLECFRDLTVAEVHRGIRERERKEHELWGPEPWRERSLLDGVEPVAGIEGPDFYYVYKAASSGGSGPADGSGVEGGPGAAGGSGDTGGSGETGGPGAKGDSGALEGSEPPP